MKSILENDAMPERVPTFNNCNNQYKKYTGEDYLDVRKKEVGAL